MSRRLWYRHLFQLARRRKSAQEKLRRPRFSTFEQLGERITPAVNAFFNAATGVLDVTGDNAANTIVVSRNAAGALLVNGGAVAVGGGTPSVANTAQINVNGQGGNDQISLDETNGALPAAVLFGGNGNDTLTGGAGNDQLFGGSGNDILLGKGGFDFLFGGADNDTLTGGDADDQVFGESGNDRMIWNPGDDTDLNEGGDGTDIVEVNGGGGAEVFTVTANGARVRFDRLNPAPFAIDIGTSENLVLNANGGDDSFSATGNLAALIKITVDGGAGNDTILGSNGVDLLLGGDGNDFIDGQQGNDVAFLGTGDDVFQWDPGDGSDVVEGQDGTDTLQFNGSNGSEIIDMTASGTRLRFTRNLGNIVMDVDDTERVNVAAFGGADTINVGNLAATDVIEVNLDLNVVGGVGDAQPDTVVVEGTNGGNSIEVLGTGDSYAVVGLSAVVNVDGSEATDQLVVNALGGNDTIRAATLPAVTVKLTIDGGNGNDTIVGGLGADTLLGGEGRDFVEGRQGNDIAFLGDGNDTFLWNPGDGSDTVEGQAGADTLQFNGSNASENINIVASGGRVLFARDVANITMDLDDVETINFAALAGADQVFVGDLSGTDVTEVNLNLAGMLGNSSGDAQQDQVVVTGTNGDDAIVVRGSRDDARVLGLTASVRISNTDGASDGLTINALGGDDTVDADRMRADVVHLTLNGGLGDDVLIGSRGDDLAVGGDGNDLALLGAGDDVFVWNPGDDNDTIEGQAGFDTLQFNGANVAENIDISANGGRVLFFRNVASVTMDLNDTEAVNFNALGGADTIVVGDLSGTDVVEINLNLAAAGGAGDSQPDNVIVVGTNGDDVILAVGDASGVSVLGLSTQVSITGAEAANDRLTVNALAGDDTVEASGLLAGAIQFTADSGDGNDVLIGGDGPDVLQGGNGDDVLLGGPGLDVLDGGPGDNIVIQ